MSVAKAVLSLTFKQILFTTDYSSPSKLALPFAAALARHYGATLHIAHILEPEPFRTVPMDTMLVDEVTEREASTEKMHEFVKDMDATGISTETVLEKGEVAATVSQIIQERNIDLIVLGTHGRGGIARLLMGSVAEQIYRHATCPVLTVGPNTKLSKMLGGKPQTILFATDFSGGSARALEYAIAFTAEHGAQLVMLHVVKPTSVPLDYTERLAEEADRKLKTLIPPGAQFAKTPLYSTPVGAPAVEILRAARLYNADLVVMGTHAAPDIVSHWPVEVANHIVSTAECPVLSVKG